MKYFFAAILITIFMFVGAFMHYTGFFKPVTISQSSEGPFIAIYKEYTGPYHKIVKTLEEVETWSKNQGSKCLLTFGEYIDDPETVEENRLRSNGGCLFKTAEEIKYDLNQIPTDFKTKTFENKKYVKASFEGAAGIGPMRVYPKVFDYLKEQALTLNGPIIEIYEIKGPKEMTTTYLFPIE